MTPQEKLTEARVEATNALRKTQPSGHVIRLDEMELASFNSARGDYMASFSNPNYPDYLIFVHRQGMHTYSQVTKLIDRFASHDNDPLPGL